MQTRQRGWSRATGRSATGTLGRFLPAHLANERVEAWHGAWWGDDRYTHHRVRPRHSYGRGWLLKNVPLPGPDTAGPAAD